LRHTTELGIPPGGSSGLVRKVVYLPDKAILDFGNNHLYWLTPFGVRWCLRLGLG